MYHLYAVIMIGVMEFKTIENNDFLNLASCCFKLKSFQ